MRLIQYKTILLTTLLLLLALTPTAVRGHFVWLGVARDDDGKASARVWFGESAAPGEGELIEKIAATELWAIDADGNRTKLEHQATVADDEGELTSGLPDKCAELAARIDYGVIDRGEGPFLLKYFARHQIASPTQPPAATSEYRFPIDLVAESKAGQLHVTVFADGKPLANAELIVQPPRGKTVETTADKHGQAVVAAKQSGVYELRTKRVDAEEGRFKGQKYGETRQYVTLTLDVQKADNAAELLQRARENRADWGDFPGFEADATVYANGQTDTGRIEVSADGEVELTGFQRKLPGVQRTLDSMIMHRMAGSAPTGKVSLVREQAPHPLGTLVKLDYDTAMGSSYRIRNDVIRQVNRDMAGGHFTISVIDVTRNQEGKYLPSNYTVTFWDQDGSQRSTNTIRDEWKRVGDIDLPERHLGVHVGEQDKLDYVELRFSNHQLLKK